jgi:hypothetical protein
MTLFISNKTFSKIFTFIVLFTFFHMAFAESENTDRQINVPNFKGSAKQLLDQISKDENLVFAYSSEVSLDFQVSFEKKQMSLTGFLDLLLKGKPVSYKIKGDKIQLFPAKTTSTVPVKLTQVVRGSIVDADSKLPLPGAAVSIAGTNPLIAASTDANGNFRLLNVPIGRINLQISFIGYEAMTLPNIEVYSGKEVVLDLNMKESTVRLDEVIIKSNKNKGEARNDMSLLSTHSISLEETKRYTGGMDDPARVVSSFAGVASTPDGSSDIIVRGNSPKYMQWRLEGTEILSPYHMDDQNASFGALTALNNNLLATSDFYTGAFSPEYGDVLSGVYDVKLRTGNNEKFEAALGVGIMGTDLTLEGPFKKGYAGSYLVNYRYSTITLIKKLGLVDVEGGVDYQDATFKVVLPTKKAGTFSFFGLGGLSGVSMENMSPTSLSTPGSTVKSALISKDYKKDNNLSNLGVNHTLTINSSSFIKTSLSYSGNGINDDIFESDTIRKYNDKGVFLRDSVTNKTQTFKNRITNSTYRAAITFSNKINAKNKIQIGFKYTLYSYNYNQSLYNTETSTMMDVTKFNYNTSAINDYISWKHSINENISFVAGLHNTNALINNKSTIEPRIAINWKLNNNNSFHAGYGKHSTMESVHNYFTKVLQPNGSITEPNKNLDLLKADHFVLGYEKRFTENLIAKVEVYYQNLYNLPVENNDTSYYSTINEGIDYRYVALVNKGKGKNYGVESTLERFFDNNYYLLINGSLFESKYKSLDGVWRNTRYNNNYLINILCGKEFKNLGKKHTQTLAINAKVFFEGGQRYIPLLRDPQGNVAVDPAKDRYWDYKNAYNNKLDNIFQLNLSVSYKFNRPKATHEIFLDMMNITDNKSRMSEYYDENKHNKTAYLTEFGFFPNLMYRVYF